ncbi:MAG: hypothetical protein PUG00_06225, partial [Clostridiales bacterium]|nr:hypothetical protein [Clostridiales bacterium]
GTLLLQHVSVPWIVFISQRETHCDKRSVPGEYNIFYVENSTYTNALTEYNDVEKQEKDWRKYI